MTFNVGQTKSSISKNLFDIYLFVLKIEEAVPVKLKQNNVTIIFCYHNIFI